MKSLIVLSATVVLLALPARGQNPPAPNLRPAPVVSPEIAPDRRVTFRLRAPDAKTVEVVGLPDTPLTMSKDAQGVWSATTAAPLPPDIYPYTFSVDGARTPDPVNLTSLWAPNATSILAVPGTPWTTSAIPHGAVAKHVYDSPIIGGPETYFVYTPPGYDARRKQPYPVLVALHGLGGLAQDWIVQGGANITLDTLISQGKAEPMILISPAANGNTQGTRAAAAGFPNFTRVLLEEILPQVERAYNASSNAADHAIAGQSAGGAQALLMLNHSDRFQWVGSFSPGTDMLDPTWGTNATPPSINGQRAPIPQADLDTTFKAAIPKGQLKLLYLSCGTADDHLALTRQFRQFMDTRSVKVTYVEGTGDLHTYSFWRPQFAAFAAMLFKPKAN
jgi:enterochelin esterase family protein